MSWKDELPPEIKEAPALKDIPDVATLAKSLIDTQTHLGNTMKIPKGDWSAEEIADWDRKIVEKAGGRLIPIPDLTDQKVGDDFFRPLGKPETPDGYVIPEDLDIDGIPEDNIKRVKDQAHTAHLTKAQFEALFRHIATDAKSGINASAQEIADVGNRLETNWGSNAAAKKQELLNKLTEVGAPSTLIEQVRDNKTNAENILFIDKVMSQIGVEGHEVGGQTGGAGVETPTGLQEQINTNEERIAALHTQEQNSAVKQQIVKLVKRNAELRVKRDSLK